MDQNRENRFFHVFPLFFTGTPLHLESDCTKFVILFWKVYSLSNRSAAAPMGIRSRAIARVMVPSYIKSWKRIFKWSALFEGLRKQCIVFSATPTWYNSRWDAINVGGCLPGAWSPCVFEQKHSDAPNYFLLHFLYILPSNFLKRCLTFYNKFKTVKNKCFRKYRSIIYYT